MRRVVILLMALMMVVAACGRAEVKPTEALSTQALTEKLSWRVIATDAAMKADIAVWREELRAERDRDLEGLKLSEGKTVVLKRGWSADGSFIVSSTILLRDEAQGSETVLMEHSNPNYSTSSSRSPIPAQALDERCFVIDWYYYEGPAGCSVFDIQEKRDIPIKFPAGALGARFLGFTGGWLYFEHGAYSYEEGDPLHITRIELSALLADNDLVAEDVIRDTQAGSGCTALYLVSPGGRYLAAMEARADYAADEEGFLLVYDLAQGERVLRLPQPEGYNFWHPHFADENVLYFYDNTDDGHVLEVRLP